MSREVLATAGIIVAVVLVAVVTDCWKRKIYNWLTLPMLVLGPAWHYAFHGLPGLWFSLKGLGVMVGIWLLLLALAGPGFGGGDVKLLAVVGAWGGLEFTLWAMLFTAVSGLLLAVPVMLRKRIVGYTLQNLALNMSARVAGGRKDVAAGDNSQGGKIPYSPCVLIGVLAAFYHPGLHLPL